MRGGHAELGVASSLPSCLPPHDAFSCGQWCQGAACPVQGARWDAAGHAGPSVAVLCCPPQCSQSPDAAFALCRVLRFAGGCVPVGVGGVWELTGVGDREGTEGTAPSAVQHPSCGQSMPKDSVRREIRGCGASWLCCWAAPPPPRASRRAPLLRGRGCWHLWEPGLRAGAWGCPSEMLRVPGGFLSEVPLAASAPWLLLSVPLPSPSAFGFSPFSHPVLVSPPPTLPDEGSICFFSPVHGRTGLSGAQVQGGS